MGRKVHPADSMAKMVTTQQEKAETTITKSIYATHQNSNVQPTSGRNMDAEVTSHIIDQTTRQSDGRGDRGPEHCNSPRPCHPSKPYDSMILVPLSLGIVIVWSVAPEMPKALTQTSSKHSKEIYPDAAKSPLIKQKKTERLNQ